MIWKKKQPFQQPFQHVQQENSDHERIARLEARIARLEAQPVQQPPVTLYSLDAGEDVLVQCVVGNEHVAVPLSQIIAQAMVTKVKANGARSPRTRVVKVEGEQKL